MTTNPVHPIAGASHEWPDQRPSDSDASGIAPHEAAIGPDTLAPTSAPELSHLKALLWIFSITFLGAGAILAGTDLASPGFGFGLGVGMVLASLGCLGFLAMVRFQAPKTDQRPYTDDAPDAPVSSSFGTDGRDGTDETDSVGPEPAGSESRLGHEVLSAYRLFGLPPEASMQEVRARYHRLAHQYHPDKVTGLAHVVRLVAEQRMKGINAAYEILQQHRARHRIG